MRDEEYWLRNCNRCSCCIKNCWKENGERTDEYNIVQFICSVDGSEKRPMYVDGCKQYSYGDPQEVKHDT